VVEVAAEATADKGKRRKRQQAAKEAEEASVIHISGTHVAEEASVVQTRSTYVEAPQSYKAPVARMW
jgi:hypothetical protein